jgi:hypothetical protein
MRSRRTAVTVSLLVLGLALAASDAHAQDNPKVAAEALFDEALALFDRGQYTEACAKFAASQKLEAATGTLLNLARCYEKAGKTASAWATYRDAQALARKENNPKREAVARTQEAALHKRLPKMTIAVAKPVEGLVVLRDDAVVDQAVFGSAVPVDPGTHVVSAKAPGKKDWQMRVDIAEARSTVVDVPVLEDSLTSASAVPAPVPRDSSQPTASAPPPDKTPREGTSALRITGLVVAGVGVVGLGVGTFFGLKAMGASDDAKPHCPLPAPCDAEGRALHDDARSAADISTIGFIAGGVLVAGGAALWFLAPSASSDRGSVRVGLRPMGLAIDGSF